MQDFTLEIYTLFVNLISKSKYKVLTFEEFIDEKDNEKNKIVLRHDVDKLPLNALKMAEIESSIGLKATYYFRIIPNVWNEEIIKKIVVLGHEVGYHYEDMTLKKGNYEQAINHFQMQLKRFRKLYPSKTICMHGSPISKYDNRKLWEKYNYSDFGIVAEPYFDVDYNRVFYITDTGRKWNDDKANVRDKVNSCYNIPINNMNQLIKFFQEDKMPSEIIINIHPHRWFNYNLDWYKELIIQNLKNCIKKVIVELK